MNILIADLDKTFISDIQRSWTLANADLSVVSSESAFMPLVKKKSIDLALIEVSFLMIDNMDMVSFLKEHQPGIEIYILCNDKNWPAATSALSRGATNFLKKPLDVQAIEDLVLKVQAQQKSESNNQLMASQVLNSLLGDTPEMRKILKTAIKIAPTTSTILITGESGSGKEFLANVIHSYSKRASEPFVAVNCGAIPDNLVESELFGSKKGSFTGSVADKKGLFESANGGTLFLDEVGELPAATQVKLLRFLQNREIRRVGETESRFVDVRIIAATNRNLQNSMKEGTFREDLYYRLNTFHLQLPPLRERRPVIPTLIRYFILKYKETYGKEIFDVDQAAQYALSKYPYPGNIRELENIVEHAIVLAENGIIRLEDLPEEVQQEALEKPVAIPHMKSEKQEEAKVTEADDGEILSLEEMERRHILHALSVCQGNKTEVCKKLGISRATLWRKLKELKIQMDGEEEG